VVARNPELFTRPAPVATVAPVPTPRAKKKGRPPKGGKRQVRTTRERLEEEGVAPGFLERLEADDPEDLRRVHELLIEEMARAGISPAAPTDATPAGEQSPAAAPTAPATPAEPPKPLTIRGVPVDQVHAWRTKVQPVVSVAAQVFGFRGEHEPKTYWKGTPLEQTVGGDLEVTFGEDLCVFLADVCPLKPTTGEGAREMKPRTALASTALAVAAPWLAPRVMPLAVDAAGLAKKLVVRVFSRMRRRR
jgi:hypothetical protein